MNELDQIKRFQQIAGINEGISKRTSGMRALQEGDETQELFNTWVQGQRETDNPVDAEFPEELRGDDEFAWERFLELISEFPNANHEDVSVAVSAVYFADLPFASLTWNDEQTARDVYESLKPDNSIQENELEYPE